MTQVSFIRRASRAAVPIFAVLVLVGCSSPLIKKPLPKELVGKLNVEKITVDKTPGVKSLQITNLVKAELVKKTREDLNKGQNAEMHVLIHKYSGPDTTLGGVGASRFLGGRYVIRARIKVIDPADKSVIAEYDAIGKYTRSLMSVDLSHGPFERLVGDFAHWAVDPLN